MGSVASRIKFVYRLLADIDADFRAVEARLKESPGLPVDNPTTSFWTVPASPLATRQDTLPPHVDVAIIGSGITGTACARALLARQCDGAPLSVVMLEARETCSGATGRNGGHIAPDMFHDYAELRQDHGIDMARKIVRFRLAHLEELMRVADEEGATECSQIRAVERLDVHFELERYEKMKAALELCKADMPEEARDVYAVDGEDAVKVRQVQFLNVIMYTIVSLQRFLLSPQIVGVIAMPAGALHPYRLVTSILSNLLTRYADTFRLRTHTPCTAIDPPSAASPHYIIHTPSGPLTAAHVVHATNGWAPHLLPGMRTKILPVRAHMSAQRAGRALAPTVLSSGRAHVFYVGHPHGMDYLTQLPGAHGTLLFGGGSAPAGRMVLAEVGCADDAHTHTGIASHVGGAMPGYFGHANWGAEGVPGGDEGEAGWGEGRVMALWTGVLGASADDFPWVGRVPFKISGRSSGVGAVGGGEWMAAGYSGEGMVHAWMCGRALAYMILGVEDEMQLSEWFPAVYRVSEARWKKATLERLAGEF
ncbi:FAD dependent oxidoreductase [Auriscalpium vulgare]|uniref:FAD dependent oxidoreductase n=1 Tax=Auriscalpium vulgare TaxID=40419 RepID=A0ACB8S1X3_9AGAM|nr:FAD dependent oxidoreductase [Auriscalpium vulgare]